MILAWVWAFNNNVTWSLFKVIMVNLAQEISILCIIFLVGSMFFHNLKKQH